MALLPSYTTYTQLINEFKVYDHRDYTELSMDDKYMVLMFANVIEADEELWDADTWMNVWLTSVYYRLWQGMPAYSCASIPPNPPAPVYDTDVYGVREAEPDAPDSVKRLDFDAM